jgi:hypothetical protein
MSFAHFKLQENPHHIACLHCQIRLKLRMFVQLCAKNYATHDGLFNNGVDDIFKFVTPLTINHKSLIYWIQFSNSKVGTRTWAKTQHLYSTKIEHTLGHFQRQPISKEIQIGAKLGLPTMMNIMPISCNYRDSNEPSSLL